MPTKAKSIRSTIIASQMALLGLFSFILLSHVPIVKAADSDFSNGITVDSTLDTPDTNIGDGICDDGDGNCTLRAAIAEANSDPDASTITFNILGAGVHTIQPDSALPQLSEQVTIDGYSQPGSSANTAAAPQPLNGTLLIEIDAANTGTSGQILQFIDNSNGSIVKGLVLNNNGSKGDGISVQADNVHIQGNYIGTNAAGTAAKPNTVGINGYVNGPDPGINTLIGGLNAEDRNLISGNTEGTTGTGAYPGEGWILQGNYFGVAADGLTPIANSTYAGSGAISIDNVPDVVVGGPEPTAINVFGDSLGHGIAPDDADNLLIEGNYVGLGYDGTTIIGNNNGTGFGSGLALSASDGVVIKNNRFAGWELGGIAVNGGNTNVSIEGNIVHNNIGHNVQIYGPTTSVQITDNILYATTQSNIDITGFTAFTGLVDDIVIQSNKIGYLSNNMPAPGEDTIGIQVFGDPTNVLIGGSASGEGNVVYGQKDAGIVVSTLEVTAFGVAAAPEKVAILGNLVTNTQTGGSGAGLGIDLVVGSDTDETPDGLPNVYTDAGVNANDPADSDTGPNNFINFPVLNSVAQEGAQATVNFNLDAADSPVDQYRVEFFANDAADASGHGEGQVFLGSTTVSNGNNQQATITLPGGTDLTGKSISATTTAIDATTNSGFGATSEFSANVAAQVTSAEAGALAPTGQDTIPIALVALILLVTGSLIMHKRYK